MQVLTTSQFKSRIREIYVSAKVGCYHQDVIQEQLTKYIRAEVNRTTGKDKRNVYSMYERGAVQMALTIYDTLHDDNLEFCYLFEGQFYSTYKVTTKLSVEELYTIKAQMDTLQRGFVYKCSDKVFYGFNK